MGEVNDSRTRMDGLLGMIGICAAILLFPIAVAGAVAGVTGASEVLSGIRTMQGPLLAFGYSSVGVMLVSAGLRWMTERRSKTTSAGRLDSRMLLSYALGIGVLTDMVGRM